MAAFAAHRRGEALEGEGGVVTGVELGAWRRRAVVLSGGLALVLVVCAVVGSDRSGRRELAAWSDDPEVAKMQETIDSLSESLQDTKRADEQAAAAQTVARAKAAAEAKEEADEKEMKHNFIAQREHTLRDVYEQPEKYTAQKALAVENSLRVHLNPSALAATAGSGTTALKMPVVPVHGLVSLRAVGSLTAALKVLEESKFTPKHTRSLATLTLSAITEQLQTLEGGVDCARKKEYDDLLANFGDMLGQLARDNATRALVDVEKKETMEKAAAEFGKIDTAYKDSTARLEKAEANAKAAHDDFVKYKTLVEELQKEEAETQKRLSTIGTDSKNTLNAVATLRTYIAEMQHAIDTGSQDAYASRQIDAITVMHGLAIDVSQKNVLRTGLNSPAKPQEMTSDILNSIEAEAQAGATGLESRLSTVQEARANAEKLYKGYQMDYITFSTDVDLQKDLQRAAHSEINQVDGRRMAAKMAYEAWKKQDDVAAATSATVTAATEQVIAKLADGLSACGGGGAAAAASKTNPTTLKAADKIRTQGVTAIQLKKQMGIKSLAPSSVHKAHVQKTRAHMAVHALAASKEETAKPLPKALKASVHAQALAGDPVLYKPPTDLNDKSTVEGIINDNAYPALHPKADENLSGDDIDEFNSAVTEADAEHKLDEPRVGAPQQAQWVNSWARKTPGAYLIHNIHLSAMDKQLLAMKTAMNEIKKAA